MLRERFIVRYYPRHLRAYSRHVEETADRDTLVSLQHVEPVQILIHPDRAVEPLSHLSLVQIAPLRGKLSFRRQQRHEIGRERILSRPRLRPGDQIHRDLHQADLNLRQRPVVRHDVVQCRQERILAVRHLRLICFFTHLAGLQIFVNQDYSCPSFILISPEQ